MSGAWTDVLRRDVLDPLARLAVQEPFYLRMVDGDLPRAAVVRYVSDTLWAVAQFAPLAADLAAGAPPGPVRDHLDEIADEEVDHPALLARTVAAAGGDPARVLGPDPSYRPTPVYEMWWSWVRSARHLPWVDAVAVVMVGLENLARFQEAMVGTALVTRYGLTAHEAEWFAHHGGEEEEAHGSLGVSILGDAVADDDAAGQARARALVERTAVPLLFAYPRELDRRYGGTADDPVLTRLAASGVDARLVEHPPGVRTADAMASALGVDAERVFKTVAVVDDRGGLALVAVPACRRVALDAVGAALGRPVRLAGRDELDTADLRPGSVSPFSASPVVVDRSIADGRDVHVGAGRPGADVVVDVADLLTALHPVVADVADGTG